MGWLCLLQKTTTPIGNPLQCRCSLRTLVISAFPSTFRPRPGNKQLLAVASLKVLHYPLLVVISHYACPFIKFSLSISDCVICFPPGLSQTDTDLFLKQDVMILMFTEESNCPRIAKTFMKKNSEERFT